MFTKFLKRFIKPSAKSRAALPQSTAQLTFAKLQERAQQLNEQRRQEEREFIANLKPPRSSAELSAMRTPNTLYSVDAKGRRVYRCEDSVTLLAGCIAHIALLRRELCLSAENFDRTILPLLLSLADNVQVLPASEGHHDIDPGGLLRHSIITAACALDTDRRGTQEFDCGRELVRLNLLCAALCHDLGKLCTDMQIFAEDGRQYTPSQLTLKDFIALTQSRFIFISFVEGRAIDHSTQGPLLWKLCDRVTAPVSKLTSALLEHPQYAALQEYTDKLVRAADAEAVQCAHHRAKEYLNLPSFITGEIEAALTAGGFTGCDLADGIFMTERGLIFGTWSPLLKRLGHEFQDLYLECAVSADKNPLVRFITYLRTTGMLLSSNQRRFKLWFKLFIEDEIYYVHGISIYTLPDLIARFNKVSCYVCGPAAPEIESFLTDAEGNPDPSIAMVVLPRAAFALSPDPALGVDLKSRVLEELPNNAKKIRFKARLDADLTLFAKEHGGTVELTFEPSCGPEGKVSDSDLKSGGAHSMQEHPAVETWLRYGLCRLVPGCPDLSAERLTELSDSVLTRLNTVYEEIKDTLAAQPAAANAAAAAAATSADAPEAVKPAAVKKKTARPRRSAAGPKSRTSKAKAAAAADKPDGAALPADVGSGASAASVSPLPAAEDVGSSVQDSAAYAKSDGSAPAQAPSAPVKGDGSGPSPTAFAPAAESSAAPAPASLMTSDETDGIPAAAAAPALTIPDPDGSCIPTSAAPLAAKEDGGIPAPASSLSAVKGSSLPDSALTAKKDDSIPVPASSLASSELGSLPAPAASTAAAEVSRLTNEATRLTAKEEDKELAPVSSPPNTGAGREPAQAPTKDAAPSKASAPVNKNSKALTQARAPASSAPDPASVAPMKKAVKKKAAPAPDSSAALSASHASAGAVTARAAAAAAAVHKSAPTPKSTQGAKTKDPAPAANAAADPTAAAV